MNGQIHFSRAFIKPFLLMVALWAYPLMGTSLADALDSWNQTFTRSGDNGFLDLAYGNGRFAAVSEAYFEVSQIFSSDDGYNWVQRAGNDPTNSYGAVMSITYAQDKFVGVGFGGSILYSTNGLNWQQIPLPPIFDRVNISLFGVTYGDGKFVAVGESKLYFPSIGTKTSTNIYVSTDGLYWGKTKSYPVAAAARDINSVAYGDNKFVAVGEEGYYYVSSDATNWARYSTISTSLKKIAYGNGRFVVAYGSTNVLVSLPPVGPPPSGINWVTVNTGTDVQINAVSFANGMFVGGGYSPLLGTNYIVSSINGTNWARSSSATLDPMTGFASDGHKFVAVGRSLLGIPGGPRTRSTAWLSDSVIDVEVESGNAGHLSISGIIGRSYQLEYLDALATNGSNNWLTLTNFALPSSPYSWTDPTATNSQRFYRAVLLP